jgi:hypothetical protein
LRVRKDALTMMHLGWFVGRGFSVHGWKQEWWGDDFRAWTSSDIDLDLARALDRACFDYVMIEEARSFRTPMAARWTHTFATL